MKHDEKHGGGTPTDHTDPIHTALPAEHRAPERGRARRRSGTEPLLHRRMVHAFLTGRRLRRGLGVLRAARRLGGPGAGRF